MTSTIRVHDRTFRPYIGKAEIAAIVTSVASQINADYLGKELTVIVVLKGAMIFASDLLRHINVPCVVETVRASSYGARTSSSGIMELESAMPSVEGRNVLIIEDIVDSGLTIECLVKELSSALPSSITVAAFLSKPDVHGNRVQIDYVGRTIAPDFVVGYGMDYAGYGRELDAIWVVENEPNDEQSVTSIT